MSVDIPKLIIHDIEKETRRRRHNQRKHYVEVPNRKGRHAGELGLTDIPTNTTWQHEVLSRTGRAFPVNTYWTCPRCKKQYVSSFPPDKCMLCGLPSPLFDKSSDIYVNWKR
jgi:rubrerythrin